MNKNVSMLGSAEVILESITDAFFAVDSEWRFTYLNQQAQVVLAHTPEAVLGKSLWEVYPGLIDTEFGKMYLGVAASRRSAAFTSYYPEHGRWYEVNCYPAPD